MRASCPARMPPWQSAVLFDLDGTLWSHGPPPEDWSEITDLQAAELALHAARLGFEHLDLPEFIRRFRIEWRAAIVRPNPTLEEIDGAAVLRGTLAERGVRCSAVDSECLWQALHNVPFRHFNIRPFPDAISTIEALDAAGYRMAIAASRPLPAQILIREMRDHGIPAVFELIVTSGDVGYRKPHQLVFETALRRLGIQPEEVVAVGDSYENDVVPAASLGMIPVLKLNDRKPDDAWILARHQVPSLAALSRLDLFRR